MASKGRAVIGAVIILALCAVCVRLGFWQLSRLEQRRAHNAVIARGLAQPPIPLAGPSLAQAGADPVGWAYRRVTATGVYLDTAEVLLRGRSDSGRPGVHVVTPLRLAGTPRLLLVNRGWIPAPDGARPPARVAAPAGPVTVGGILMEIPVTGDRGTPSGGGASYRRLDLAEMRRLHGEGVLPLYLQASAGGDSLPRAVPAPTLDEGPHLSYALQWFGFAAIGVIGLLVLLLRSRAGP